MSRAWPRLAAALACALAGWPRLSLARDALTPPPPLSSQSQRVARALDGTVPAGLAVAQVVAPALPAGDVSATWKAPPHPGWVAVLATVRSRGHEVGRAWARVELKPLRRVLVAGRALAVGELLGVGALDVAEKPVAVGEGIAVTGDDGAAALAGARVTRALAAGQILLEADVARPPLMARGMPVRVVVRRGAVTVTAFGALERAARVSDRTSARLNELGRLVSGRLVDGSTLIADEGTP